MRPLIQAFLDDLLGWTTFEISWTQRYAVEASSRMLFTLERGEVISKPDALDWAETAIPAEWRELIDQVRQDRHVPWNDPPAAGLGSSGRWRSSTTCRTARGGGRRGILTPPSPRKGSTNALGPTAGACLRRPLSHHLHHVDHRAVALSAGARRPRGYIAGGGRERQDPVRGAAGAVADHREHRHRRRDLPDRQATERGACARVCDRPDLECTFILVGIVAVLGIVTLQQEVAGAAEGTVAYTLAAIKDWTFLLGPGWVVGWGNGLILGYLMYSSGLVPRRMTWLGLVGGPLIILSGTLVLLDVAEAGGVLQSIATIPEFLWELFLGVYCTVKGFLPSSPILQGDVSREPLSRSAPPAATS
jgi:hypothetical protein